jgi:hypothetical protein
MVNFVVNQFSSSVTLSELGKVFTQPIPSLSTNSTGTVYVPLSAIKNIFKYKTTDVELIDISAQDLEYFVYDKAWPVINPANTMIDPATAIAIATPSGSIPANKLLVAHDFVRYLAQQLFGTALGAELFDNELELVENVRKVCDNSSSGHTWYDVTTAIKNVSVNSTASLVGLGGSAGAKYMTNDNTTNANICRVLLEQMFGADPARFHSIVATDQPQSLPFQVGDSINFPVSISPAYNQQLLTQPTSTTQIPPRSYTIKMSIIADNDTSSVNVPFAANELSLYPAPVSSDSSLYYPSDASGNILQAAIGVSALPNPNSHYTTSSVGAGNLYTDTTDSPATYFFSVIPPPPQKVYVGCDINGIPNVGWGTQLTIDQPAVMVNVANGGIIYQVPNGNYFLYK